MGCDIHIYRERRIDTQWETDTKVEQEGEGEDAYKSYESGMGYFSRNYWLFAALSQVRCYEALKIPAPAHGRELPDDMTDMQKANHEQWDADAHSAGWLDMAELQELINKYEHGIVLYEGEFHPSVHEALVGLKEQAGTGGYFDNLAPEDCRIIFWYDN